MAPDPQADPDEVRRLVESMNRHQLTEAILHFESKAPLDFAPGYLAGLSVHALRHLLWTAILCLTPS